MKIEKMKNMVCGWFVGDFEPSVYRTKKFEVSFKSHKKNEKTPPHYHKKAIEINYLIHGRMIINGIELNSGDIFTIEKNETVYPKFLTNCELIVVKTPSVINDKYEKSEK